MYKKIEGNPLFEDIESEAAKRSLDMLVDYLCSMPVAEKEEAELLHNNNYKDLHKLFAESFYSSQNLEMVEEILKYRVEFENIDSCDAYHIDGYSHIDKPDKEKIMELGTMQFYKSVLCMEHELIHTLMALNNNNPKPQHAEVLPLFGELAASLFFSQQFNDPNIYETNLINRCISRMSFRVKASYFSDENLEKHEEWVYKSECKAYPYMIGFIYASRLLAIYGENPCEVTIKVNEVLGGEITMQDLLDHYSISLTDSKTCGAFIDLCEQYKSLVEKRYSPEELHSVK